MELKENDVIGGYRVIRELGKGGCGAVYEVEHENLKKRLAMKVFTGHGEYVEVLCEKFISEARSLAQLDHPGLVRTYDLGYEEERKIYFFTMDLFTDEEGRPMSAADYCERKQLSDETLLGWYEDLKGALEYLHRKGVVHRDIKPGNVLIDREGHAHFTDFGIAKITGDLQRTIEAAQTMVYTANRNEKVVFGTPGFMSPEIERGEDASFASDIYALGCTLFNLLTGFIYNPQETNLELMVKPFGEKWIELLRAMLAVDPAKRRLPSLKPRRKSFRWALQTGIAAAVAVVVVVVGALFSEHSPKVSESPSSERAQNANEAFFDAAFSADQYP